MLDGIEARRHFLEKIRGRPDLWPLVEKLDSGTGTYADVKEIAEMMGDEVAKYFTESFDQEVYDTLMREAHAVITMASETAQTNLNNAAQIGLKPLTRKYPKAAAAAIGEKLGVLDPEVLKKVGKDAISTLLMQMVDENVKYNADFQADAGLQPLIVRIWSGSYPSHDTKHTDWCEGLAGVYEYGTEPKNVYARHEGCRCTVEYYPNATAKGNITALSKGEVDVDSVLWNTREDTLAQRIRKAGL